ncbi:hypothetical protein BKA70DRAFT_1259930 [Coprinopsis sp. MPI-PUGE-AT-0042]|nr:hypothetical protein BKA70DRAFT_1259930 [Coprinopsis sp. MPI-PUGE-AT-0042]
MSTPYRYSPQVPAGPNPTPLAGLPARAGNKLTRPPLQNPFDKFNQGEFDSWIGGITSALRKALGQEEEIQKAAEAMAGKPSDGQSFGLKDVDMEAGQEADESILEDSFADFKARRSVKGKERDPREGPGLAGADGWNADEPIELLSDDEDEEGQGNQDLLFDNGWEGEGDGEEDDERGSWDGDEGRSPSLELESQPHHGQRLEVPQEQEVFELEDSEEEYEEDPEESYSYQQANFLDVEAVVDDDDEEGDPSHEVYEEEYDEDEEPEDQQYEVGAAPHQIGDGQDEEYEEQDAPDDQEYEDEEEPRSSPPVHLAEEVDDTDEIIEVRDDSPVEVDLSPSESFQYPDDEPGGVQPLADDTSFPPRQEEGPSHDEVAIPDPWVGPETYAEDFYSSGDAAIAHGSHLQPDILGEEQEGHNLAPYMSVDEDEVFPPPNNSLAQTLPLELPGVWEGPQNYAEDFYSGGDFKVPDGATFDVHQLESDRQGILTPVVSWDENPGNAQAVEDLQGGEKELFVVEDVPLGPMEQSPQPDSHEVDEQPSFSQLEASDGEDEIMEILPPAQSQTVHDVVQELQLHAMLETTLVEIYEEHDEEPLGDAPLTGFEQMATTEESLEVVDETAPFAAAVHVETSLMTTQVLTVENGDSVSMDAANEFNIIAEESPSQLQDAPLSPELAAQTLEDAPIEVEEQASPSLPTVGGSEEGGAPEATQESLMEVDENADNISPYSVTEIRSEGEEGTSDDDADGEDVDDDVEILSVSSGVELMERAEFFEEPDETEAESVTDSVVSVPNGSALPKDGMPEDAKSPEATAEAELTEEEKLEEETGSNILEGNHLREASAMDFAEPSGIPVKDEEPAPLHHEEPVIPQDAVQVLDEEASLAVVNVEEASIVLDEPEDQEPVEFTVAEVSPTILYPDTPDDASIASIPPKEPGHQEQDEAGRTAIEPDLPIAEPPMLPEEPAKQPDNQAANLTSPPLGTVIDEDQLPPGLVLEPSNSEDDDAPLHNEEAQAPPEDMETIECDDKTPSRLQTPHDKSVPLPVEDVSMSESPAPSTHGDEVMVSEPGPASLAVEQPLLNEQTMAPGLTLIPPTPNAQLSSNLSSTRPSLIEESYPASLSTPRYSAAAQSAVLNYHAQNPPLPLPVGAPTYPFQASIYPPLPDQPSAVEASSDQSRIDSALWFEAVAKSDPFKLMGTNKHFFPGEAQNDGPDVGEASRGSGEATSQVDQVMKSPPVEATNTLPSRKDDVFDLPGNPLEQDAGPNSDSAAKLTPSALETPAVPPPAASPAKVASSATKRKRQNTGTKSKKKGKDKQLDGDKPVGADKSIRVKPRPLPKGKAKRSTSPVAKSKAPQSSASGASGSSASSAARMLLPPGNNRGSRASSVASSAASDVRSQASPTVSKPVVTLLTQPPMSQPPLFHAHGAKRKQLQHLSFASAQNVLQGRSPSFNRLGDATSPVSPTAPSMQPEGSQQGTLTAPVRRNHTWTSSPVPVTRSHCRFHKISIPRDDDGPRIYFIVPGCSLTKEEVMEEEEVIDHGDATYEDSQRMVEDVESLGFEDFLINSLRLLVGAEIFREREIFYLPLPGEEVRRRKEPGPKQPLLATGSSSLGASLKSDANLADQVFSSTESEASSEEDGSDYEEVKAPATKKARAMRGEKSETNKPVGDTAQAAPSHSHNPKTSRPGPQKRPRQEGQEAEDARPSKKVRPQTAHAASNLSTGAAEELPSPLSPISDLTHT